MTQNMSVLSKSVTGFENSQLLNVSNITRWTKLNVILYNEIVISINFFFCFNVLLTMHLDNLCNENQLDALFILNLLTPNDL
jgi:hypothetical protein